MSTCILCIHEREREEKEKKKRKKEKRSPPTVNTPLSGG